MELIIRVHEILILQFFIFVGSFGEFRVYINNQSQPDDVRLLPCHSSHEIDSDLMCGLLCYSKDSDPNDKECFECEAFNFKDGICDIGIAVRDSFDSSYNPANNPLLDDFHYIQKSTHPLGTIHDYTSLFITGGDYSQNAEIIDILNPTLKCTLPNLANTRNSWSHVIWHNFAYQICGTENSHATTGKNCEMFKDNDWEPPREVLKEQRAFSIPVHVPNHGWFFTGGLRHNKDTTEILGPFDETTRDGPKLPTKLYSHCTTQYNSTITLIFGGIATSGVLSTAYAYDWSVNDGTWKSLPDIYDAVYGSLCIAGITINFKKILILLEFLTITLLGPNGEVFIVAGSKSGNVGQKITEILDPTFTTWNTGHTFPITIWQGQITMVRDEIYVFGGYYGGGSASDKFYKYGVTEWETMSFTMSFNRAMFGAIKISSKSAYDICQNV